MQRVNGWEHFAKADARLRLKPRPRCGADQWLGNLMLIIYAPPSNRTTGQSAFYPFRRCRIRYAAGRLRVNGFTGGSRDPVNISVTFILVLWLDFWNNNQYGRVWRHKSAQSATRSWSQHTHILINLLVKATQKKVDGTGGQSRGSERTWVEMGIDGKKKGRGRGGRSGRKSGVAQTQWIMTHSGTCRTFYLQSPGVKMMCPFTHTKKKHPTDA